MDINSLEPNSHKYRQEKVTNKPERLERKRLEKVISGTAIIQKKGLIKRFIETFFVGDTKDVKSYLIFDVLIPSIKETLNSLVNKGTEMILFGDSSRPAAKRSGGTYVSYGSAYKNDRERTPSRQNRMVRKFDDVVFETRGDAEQVIDILMECISLYDQATVADFYDAAGISSDWAEPTDDYGWTDLSSVNIMRIRNGYILDLPKCVKLN